MKFFYYKIELEVSKATNYKVDAYLKETVFIGV